MHLAVCDGAHQRRLAAPVVPAHPVPLAPFQVQARIIQQNLGAVAERKLCHPPSATRRLFGIEINALEQPWLQQIEV